MKILVLIKQVPDTWGDRKLDAVTGRADRGASDAIIDEVGERAVEAALVAQEQIGAEVVVATMGPASAEESLRKTLAMGADEALHIVDDSLAGSDLLRTARVLAAVSARVEPDLILAGNESTDGRGGVIPAMLAEITGRPHATFLSAIEITASAVAGTRATEGGTAQVEATLPAVASVTEQAPEARFPSFRGIMKAKKKPLSRLSVADLGIESDGAHSSVLAVAERPARTAGTKVVDDGTAGTLIAEYLVSSRLV